MAEYPFFDEAAFLEVKSRAQKIILQNIQSHLVQMSDVNPSMDKYKVNSALSLLLCIIKYAELVSICISSKN